MKVINLGDYKRGYSNREFVEDYLTDIAVDVFRSTGVEQTQENIADFANGFIDCLLSDIEFTGVIENYCFADYLASVAEVEAVRQDKTKAYIMGFTYQLYYVE